ncbi:unnamed protein product [Dracunculus medinensis]|uniref:Zf-Tim10_DDP domain-containing protein n=1 Tax=Dracunculus medinensis TaxID=318479 RepID=A0A0N4UJM9_DRAME|nr:unnamed protein product [Dracunculus medinensis]
MYLTLKTNPEDRTRRKRQYDCSFVLGKTIKFCEDMGQRQSENRQYVDQESKALWEVEMEMMSDLFKRLSNSCHQKEAELTKGETVCLDRCVSKFMDLHQRLGQKLTAITRAEEQQLQSQMIQQQQQQHEQQLKSNCFNVELASVLNYHGEVKKVLLSSLKEHDAILWWIIKEVSANLLIKYGAQKI